MPREGLLDRPQPDWLPKEFRFSSREGAIRREGERVVLEVVGDALARRLDLMIASHALAVGATLIASDIGEFRRVPGLRCEDWTRS